MDAKMTEGRTVVATIDGEYYAGDSWTAIEDVFVIEGRIERMSEFDDATIGSRPSESLRAVCALSCRAMSIPLKRIKFVLHNFGPLK